MKACEGCESDLTSRGRGQRVERQVRVDALCWSSLLANADYDLRKISKIQLGGTVGRKECTIPP